jgi:hypothetical protein
LTVGATEVAPYDARGATEVAPYDALYEP